jgi:hypothetical protein
MGGQDRPPTHLRRARTRAHLRLTVEMVRVRDRRERRSPSPHEVRSAGITSRCAGLSAPFDGRTSIPRRRPNPDREFGTLVGLSVRSGISGRSSAPTRTLGIRRIQRWSELERLGAWLRWLERSLHTAEVGGSSPPAPTPSALVEPHFRESPSDVFAPRARSVRDLQRSHARTLDLPTHRGPRSRAPTTPVEGARSDPGRPTPTSDRPRHGAATSFGEAPAAIQSATAVCRRSMHPQRLEFRATYCGPPMVTSS